MHSPSMPCRAEHATPREQTLWACHHVVGRCPLSRCRLPRTATRSSKPMAVRLLQMNHAAEACMSRRTSGNSQWDASPRWATVGWTRCLFRHPSGLTPAPSSHPERSLPQPINASRPNHTSVPAVEGMVARAAVIRTQAFSRRRLPARPRHHRRCRRGVGRFSPWQPGPGLELGQLGHGADIRGISVCPAGQRSV